MDDALPRAIGRPATNALAAAGITTLSAAVERSDAELLALHGVGPKAVRVLREAAAETATGATAEEHTGAPAEERSLGRDD